MDVTVDMAWLQAYLDLTNRLSATDKAAIDGQNAARVYGLSR